MRKFADLRGSWLVFKHELQVTLGRRSFWITTIVLPLVIVAFQVLPQVLIQSELGEDTNLEEALASVELQPLAYVDLAGVIGELPSYIASDLVIAYPDLETGRQALENEDISSLYVIQADYIQTGDITRIDVGQAALEQTSHEYLLNYLIDYGISGDAALVALLQDPAAAARDASSQMSLAPETSEKTSSGNSTGFDLTGYALMMVLFMTIVGAGSLVLQSVASEKENRTAEVLLLSIHPRDFMLGKLLAMGIASLVQLVIWLSTAYMALGNSDTLAMLGMTSQITFAPGLVLWGILFGVLGYAVYAAMFGALGALAPTAREGAQFQIIVMIPLILPLMFNYTLMSEPNGMLAQALSLVPFTSPITMIMRMSMITVPVWQIVTSLALLLVTAYGMVALSGRFFRADTLLSGLKLDWKRILSVFKAPEEA